MMTFRIELFKGAEAEPYVRPLSEMRVTAFSQFPYLYGGNVEDALLYAQQFSSSPQEILVVAFQGETIAGICSGTPLQKTQNIILDKGHFQQFEKQGIKAHDYYYCSEFIVNPPFQRMGLASQLITNFIKEVETMSFQGIMAITSIRPLDHPLRPQNYFEISTLLAKFGFQKNPVICMPKYSTRQLDGTVKEEENECACWFKAFDTPPLNEGP